MNIFWKLAAFLPGGGGTGLPLRSRCPADASASDAGRFAGGGLKGLLETPKDSERLWCPVLVSLLAAGSY